MTIKAFLITSASVLGFASLARAKEAHAKLAGSFLVTSEKDLMTVPNPVLVKINNEALGAEGEIKRFRDSKTASARVFPLLPKVAVIPEAEEEAAKAEEKKPAATAAKKDKKPAAATATGKEKPATGKAPQFAGKKLKRTGVGMEATRREDTRRTASWNALKDGMTFEEAVKAGARPADLDKMYRLGHIAWK